jgi:hypothetical protein
MKIKNFWAWISGVEDQPVVESVTKKTFPPRDPGLCSFNEWAQLTQFSSLHEPKFRKEERLDHIKKEVREANKHF